MSVLCDNDILTPLPVPQVCPVMLEELLAAGGVIIIMSVGKLALIATTRRSQCLG
jgi:hypothetical protein